MNRFSKVAPGSDVKIEVTCGASKSGGGTTTLASLGVTASAGELNILDGATLDVNELNILDGATITTNELNSIVDNTDFLLKEIDDQSIPNGGGSNYTMTMKSASILESGTWTHDTTTVTIPNTGLYEIKFYISNLNGNAFWSGLLLSETTYDSDNLFVLKNSENLYGGMINTYNATNSIILSLSALTTITVRAWSSSGVSNTAGYLSVKRIGNSISHT